jgi:hypothetical protein
LCNSAKPFPGASFRSILLPFTLSPLHRFVTPPFLLFSKEKAAFLTLSSSLISASVKIRKKSANS